MYKKLDTDAEPTKRRIDLSVAQVAGSAVAAVVAAVLASQLGVYGTVIGAGVVSVVATSGGTIFQHVFRRTGEQLREVTVHAKPKGRPSHVDDATRVLRTVEVPAGLGEGQLPGGGEFTEATVHGSRKRGWKRSVLAAAVVFAVAMAGITTYELIASPLSGNSKPAIESVFRGGGEKKTPPAEQPPATTGPDRGTSGTGGTPDPGAGEQSPDPGTATGGQTPDPGATTTPDPGGSDGSATDGGGTKPPPTPPAKETPGDGDRADSGGTDGNSGNDDGTDGGNTDGTSGQNGDRQLRDAPPAPGATSAP
ncbi:hypothetical protein ACQPZG_08900 [Streptomyces sp. CA-294286]|uniref:hypothetical protein n=1 Tax=Streptomyces sp. CA-294286 TaxID=3240070 RepID=UPI003D8D056A